MILDKINERKYQELLNWYNEAPKQMKLVCADYFKYLKGDKLFDSVDEATDYFFRVHDIIKAQLENIASIPVANRATKKIVNFSLYFFDVEPFSFEKFYKKEDGVQTLNIRALKDKPNSFFSDEIYFSHHEKKDMIRAYNTLHQEHPYYQCFYLGKTALTDRLFVGCIKSTNSNEITEEEAGSFLNRLVNIKIKKEIDANKGILLTTRDKEKLAKLEEICNVSKKVVYHPKLEK